MNNLARSVKNNTDDEHNNTGTNTSRRKERSKKKRRRRVNPRRMASWILRDLRSAAKVMRDSGEILDAAAWLEVGADILSSAPPGLDGNHQQRTAPERIVLNIKNLTVFAARCGLPVHEIANEIEAEVNATIARRDKESERVGKKHYARMTPDKIGERLGITDATREEAKAFTLGTFGGSPQARAKAARERDKDRKTIQRRDNGVVPRADWLAAHSQSRTKPWDDEGISQSTWRRLQKKLVTEVCPNPMSAHVTEVCPTEVCPNA